MWQRFLFFLAFFVFACKSLFSLFWSLIFISFCFYTTANSNKCASELLDLPPNSSWEVQLSYLITHVLSSVGLELVRWTRVPYLCEGDFTQSFYYLNDLVLVLRVRETRASTPSVHWLPRAHWTHRVFSPKLIVLVSHGIPLDDFAVGGDGENDLMLVPVLCFGSGNSNKTVKQGNTWPMWLFSVIRSKIVVRRAPVSRASAAFEW